MKTEDLWGFFSKKTSSLQCDEVKTHVVTNLESFQWSTYQCRQTIQSLLVLEILPTSSSRPSAMFPVVFHAPSP